VALDVAEISQPGRSERGFDLGTDRKYIDAEGDQVADLFLERIQQARRYLDRRDLDFGRFDGGNRWSLDELARIAGDRRREIDVETLGTDAVRVQPDIMLASSEFFHSDGADSLPVELPTEEPDLAASEQPLGSLDILERSFHREHGR
jgi:hypothetical protein